MNVCVCVCVCVCVVLFGSKFKFILDSETFYLVFLDVFVCNIVYCDSVR